MFAIRADGDGFCFDVLVQPRASRNRIGPLSTPKRNVAVASGSSGRRKTLRVVGVDRAAIEGLAS